MGFETKFEASDDYVSMIRKRHGIADLASQLDMEEIVKELLAAGGSKIDDAITLVMNRRVDARDPIAKDVFWVKSPVISVDDKYATLLMAVSMT